MTAAKAFTVEVETETGTLTGHLEAADGNVYVKKWTDSGGHTVKEERAHVGEYVV